MLIQDPLTDEEFEELDRFLLDAEGLDESLRLPQCGQLLLAHAHALQGRFPVLLELRRDQPVVGIARGIATS